MSKRSLIKLLVFLPEVGLGGAEWQTIYMLNGLDENLITSKLLTLNRGTDERDKIPDYHIEIEKSLGIDMTFGRRLAKIIKNESPDVIHLISSTAILWGIFTTRFNRSSRIICSLWGEDYGMSSLRRLLLRTALHFSDLVTVNSYDLRRTISREYRIPQSRIDVLVNGVDTERFAPRDVSGLRKSLGISENEFVIGWVGNIRTEKDFDTLILTARTILKKYDNVRFLVVGGGVDFENAMDDIKNAGLEERFIFSGRVDDTSDYYNIMNILVNTSISEGMCNVILEASSSGLACVVTDAPGNSEIVLDGRTGFVVRKKDYCALAERVSLLIDDIRLRHKMGLSGREYVLNIYALNKMVLNYQNLYLRICERL